jgi:hypothetical protein
MNFSSIAMIFALAFFAFGAPVPGMHILYLAVMCHSQFIAPFLTDVGIESRTIAPVSLCGREVSGTQDNEDLHANTICF